MTTAGLNVQSARFTANGDVISEPGVIWGVLQNTNGVNDCVVVLHDGGSSNEKYEFTCLGGDISYGAIFSGPIQCASTIRLVISGSGASCIVIYEKAQYWTA